MTTFIQIHLLTAYPPANLNRDDTGKPKTAQFGNVMRLRVSSQALKRAWRTSDAFKAALDGHLGERTQRLGGEFTKQLVVAGVETGQAASIGRVLASIFGKIETKQKKELFIKQLAFVSADEQGEVSSIIARIASDDAYRARFVKAASEVSLDDAKDDGSSGDAKKGKRSKETTALIKEMKSQVFKTVDGAVDIAMFGRMLADDPDFNRHAAVQVAHAITTHRAIVEDDYYTAVDDLKNAAEDAGAGFVGEAGFGAPLLYLYICIDRDLLVCNLAGDEALARRGIAALVEAAATVSPKGKQASFASRALASYGLVERGSDAPRTLAASFLKPIDGKDALGDSIKALEKAREKFARAYGESAETATMNVEAEIGTLDDLIALAAR